MTPKILTDLIVKELADDTWEIAFDFKYQSEIYNTVILVPAGFVTDFASVPRLPVAFLLTGDTAHEAAVVHDYLYQTHICGKAMADDIFEEAMEVTGIEGWRRKMMYWAVHFFGGSSYNSGPQRFTKLNA